MNLFENWAYDHPVQASFVILFGLGMLAILAYLLAMDPQ
jgi:hypothetical protein